MASAEWPSIALIFTGHLRDTCNEPAAAKLLLQQVDYCRRAASAGRCDVYMHTWDTLHPASMNTSTACAANVSALLSAVAHTVERQKPSSSLEQRDSKAWGTGREKLASFRFNSASMLGGIELSASHRLDPCRSFDSSNAPSHTTHAHTTHAHTTNAHTQFRCLAPAQWQSMRSGSWAGPHRGMTRRCACGWTWAHRA